MPDSEYGLSLERRFPWSFLGFIAGTIFGLIGVYSVFFYSREPDFRVQVISKSPVISIREEVPNLEIMLNGTDVRKAHKGISLLTFKVSNAGNLAITTGDFDAKQPFSVQVVNGEVIRSTLLESSESYFDTVWKEVTTTSNSLVFPAFIIEPQQYFIVKLLVLHDETATPTIVSHGKIARTGRIAIVDRDAALTTEEAPATAFGGDSKVQIFRILTYGLGTALCVALMIAIVVFSKSRIEFAVIERRGLRRRLKIEAYLATLDDAVALRLRPLASALASGSYFAMNELQSLTKRVLTSDDKEIRIDPRLFLGRHLHIPEYMAIRESKPITVDKQLAIELQRLLRFLKQE